MMMVMKASVGVVVVKVVEDLQIGSFDFYLFDGFDGSDGCCGCDG